MIVKRICLFSLFWCTVTLGAPVEKTMGLNIQTQSNPIDMTVNIAGWPNEAEENCFAMLCLENGNRV
jgi:hypothetical protein